MRATSCCLLILLLLSAFGCSKNDSTIGPSVGSTATTTSSSSMSGGWGVTWLGWYANYSGTLTGTMTLTERDSMLSGWIFLHNQTFSVAGFVSSAYQVTLTGTDGGYEYSIIGTVDASKSILNGKVDAAHMGLIPRDTVGAAIFSANRYK